MLSNNSKVQLLIKIAATGALSFLLVLYGTQKKSSADTSLLTIISPSQGALVTPGSIITVEVGVDPDKIFPGGVVVLGPSGVDGPLFAPPFEFSVPVSKTIAIGTAELWALGIEADGSFEVSSPVTLHVERLDPPINFRVMPTQVLFRVIGEQRHLDVLGVFSDGVARTLNESIETVFTAEDQSVAMVSYTGVVTATGPGDTTITVEHKGIVTTIPISVLESLRGDINGDGEVNSDDLNEIIALSGNPASSPFDPADLNRNGVIDEQDQNILRTLCTDIDCVTGPSVLVPFVLGFNQAEAEARITNVGLVVGEVVLAPSDNIAAGLVVEQDPAAGASLSAGNSVDLVVSSGPTTLTVPDVVGLSQSDAEAAIVAAGLVLGTVTTEHSATVPAGDVTSQNPEAGTEVVEGSAVALVVSSGPITIDIKPGSDTNSINLKSNGVIPVAILTTGTFDATTVDPLSVEFGPNGAMESHGKGHIEDADVDGDDDLVLHFRIQETGIACGDTSAFLKGETFDRELIEGSDLINTVGCK